MSKKNSKHKINGFNKAVYHCIKNGLKLCKTKDRKEIFVTNMVLRVDQDDYYLLRSVYADALLQAGLGDNTILKAHNKFTNKYVPTSKPIDHILGSVPGDAANPL